MKNLYFKTLIILLILFNYDVALGQYSGSMSRVIGVERINEFNGYIKLIIEVNTPQNHPLNLELEKRLLKIRTKRFLKEEMGWEERSFDTSTNEGLKIFNEFYKTSVNSIELITELIPISLGSKLHGYAFTCKLFILEFVETESTPTFMISYNNSHWLVKPDDEVEEGLSECNETMLEYLLIDYYDGQD